MATTNQDNGFEVWPDGSTHSQLVILNNPSGSLHADIRTAAQIAVGYSTASVECDGHRYRVAGWVKGKDGITRRRVRRADYTD